MAGYRLDGQGSVTSKTSLSGLGSYTFSCVMLIRSFFSEGFKVCMVTDYKPLGFSVHLFELE